MQKINFFQTFLTKTKTNQKDHYHKQNSFLRKNTPKKATKNARKKGYLVHIYSFDNLEI